MTLRIKAKQGYNIVINDINISLQNGKDYIEVDDELFSSSSDVKRVLKFIDIEKVKVKKEKVKTIDTTPIHVEKPANGVVMMQNDEKTRNTGAVVFDPNKEANPSVVHTENKLISDKTEIKATESASVNVKEEQLKEELKIEVTLPDKQSNIVNDNAKENVKENEKEIKVDKKTKKNKKDNKEETK